VAARTSCHPAAGLGGHFVTWPSAGARSGAARWRLGLILEVLIRRSDHGRVGDLPAIAGHRPAIVAVAAALHFVAGRPG
jgi:hypothetical protein